MLLFLFCFFCLLFRHYAILFKSLYKNRIQLLLLTGIWEWGNFCKQGGGKSGTIFYLLLKLNHGLPPIEWHQIAIKASFQWRAAKQCFHQVRWTLENWDFLYICQVGKQNIGFCSLDWIYRVLWEGGERETRAFFTFLWICIESGGEASIVHFPTMRDNSMNGTGLEHLFWRAGVAELLPVCLSAQCSSVVNGLGRVLPSSGSTNGSLIAHHVGMLI